MAGGLMQLVSEGQQNIILNGNPSKTFSKQHTLAIQISVYKNFVLTLKAQKLFV